MANIGDAVDYYYTGGEQTYTVPNGVNRIRIQCWGAKGGDSESTAISGGRRAKHYYGGNGAYTNIYVDTSPGEVFRVYVGSMGGSSYNSQSTSPGGWNGGGNGGGCASNLVSAGGGGGATDVRRYGNALGNRIIVAGGGGGAGSAGGSGAGVYSGKGGYASDPGATGGFGYGYLDKDRGDAGRGGSNSSGGRAGNINASAGGYGYGGNGAYNTYGGGGGGGGGTYGGGGGANGIYKYGAGGGGGGGSFPNTSGNFNNGSGRCYIDVQGIIMPSSVNISNSSITLKKRKGFQLTASVVPSDANNTGINWYSSNTGIATISGGYVQAYANVGSCTIYAKASANENVYATCTVNVECIERYLIYDAWNKKLYNNSGTFIAYGSDVASYTNFINYGSLPSVEPNYNFMKTLKLPRIVYYKDQVY